MFLGGLILVLVIALVATLRVQPWRRLSWFSGGSTTVMAAIPYWDQADAVTSLRAHPGRVSIASPWSYGVDGAGQPVLQPGLTEDSERALNLELKSLGLSVFATIANTTDGL